MSGLALVLSGGGAKAAAHLGAIRALKESGRVPSRYVATSMGAVCAVAVAAGMEPAAVLERLVSVGRLGVRARPLVPLAGLWLDSLLDGGAFRGALASIFPARRFSELRVPVTVTVTELATGAQLLFGEGGEDAPLVDVLAAACALPGWFPPVSLGGRPCADGGLRGVVPLDVALRFPCSHVVAVDVGEGFDTAAVAPARHTPAMVAAHDRAVGILMASHTRLMLEWWRADPSRPPLTWVRPTVARGATFRLDLLRTLDAEGYRAMRAVL